MLFRWLLGAHPFHAPQHTRTHSTRRSDHYKRTYVGDDDVDLVYAKRATSQREFPHTHTHNKHTHKTRVKRRKRKIPHSKQHDNAHAHAHARVRAASRDKNQGTRVARKVHTRTAACVCVCVPLVRACTRTHKAEDTRASAHVCAGNFSIYLHLI